MRDTFEFVKRPSAGCFRLLFIACPLLFVSCKTGSHAGEIGQFRLGEPAQIGSLVYTVLDTQWMVSLGKAPEERVPANRFFIVSVTAANPDGNHDETVPGLELVDDAGQNYMELGDGQGVPEWLGLSRRVHPKVTLAGNVIFDVPPKHYRLKITDESQQRYAWVDIPFSLGTPAPRVDSPAPPSQ